VLVILDVKGAAWCPSILNGLKACGCPKNLYNLTKSYFSQQTAVLSTNSIRMEGAVIKVYPQGSRCCPGLWNNLYNSLLNLKLTTPTKAVAFADDLILAVRGKRACEAEKFWNWKLSKITAWSKSNKIKFNREN